MVHTHGQQAFAAFVEELTAKVNAMSPENRGKIMTALQDYTEVKVEETVAPVEPAPVTEVKAEAAAVIGNSGD